MLSTVDLRCEENTEVELGTVGLWMLNSWNWKKNRSVSRWVGKNKSLTNSLRVNEMELGGLLLN